MTVLALKHLLITAIHLNVSAYTVANHACRTKFTPGQVDRMKAQFEIYRYVAPPATKAPTPAPSQRPTNAPAKAPTKLPTRTPSNNTPGGTLPTSLSPFLVPKTAPINRKSSQKAKYAL